MRRSWGWRARRRGPTSRRGRRVSTRPSRVHRAQPQAPARRGQQRAVLRVRDPAVRGGLRAGGHGSGPGHRVSAHRPRRAPQPGAGSGGGVPSVGGGPDRDGGAAQAQVATRARPPGRAPGWGAAHGGGAGGDRGRLRATDAADDPGRAARLRRHAAATPLPAAQVLAAWVENLGPGYVGLSWR